MAIMRCSKLQFLFVCEQKQLARVLPESSAVICAEFSGVSTNYTAIITKCFEKVFVQLFSKSWRGVERVAPHTALSFVSFSLGLFFQRKAAKPLVLLRFVRRFFLWH